MELKGIITLGENKSITCCLSIQDLKIGELSLYDELEKLFNLDAEEYWNDYGKKSPEYAVRYVILEEELKEEKSFEQQSAEVVMEMLYGELVSGCYSEWTCGYGDFDYVTGENGHSIFEELKGSVGKYLHLKI